MAGLGALLKAPMTGTTGGIKSGVGESIPGDKVAWRSASLEIRAATMRPKAAGVDSLDATERGSRVREMSSRRMEGTRIGTRWGVRPGLLVGAG